MTTSWRVAENGETVEITIQSLLNRRVLFSVSDNRSWTGNGKIDEYKVLEVSPSSNWVKLMNLNGSKFWIAIKNMTYVEALIDVVSEKRPTLNRDAPLP